MTAYNIHPLAEMIPAMTDDEYVALREDIRERGMNESIVLYEGMVLDGRHRARVCAELEIDPNTKEYEGNDPVAFVLSANIRRRHLTPGQLAMVGARARQFYDEQAKGRQRLHGGTAPGVSKTLPANMPEVKTDARDAVGRAVGVSGKSIDYATRVLRDAVPEIVKAVDEGRMAISTAAILASEAEEIQRQEATKPLRNREYRSISKGSSETEEQEGANPESEPAVKGVGVLRANEAINCLTRIPASDPLRRRGLQIVADWIKANKRG